MVVLLEDFGMSEEEKAEIEQLKATVEYLHAELAKTATYLQYLEQVKAELIAEREKGDE